MTHKITAFSELFGEAAYTSTIDRNAQNPVTYAERLATLAKAALEEHHAPEMSKRLYQEAIAQNPDMAHYHAGLGRIFMNDRNYKTAKEPLKMALALEPDNLEYKGLLGIALVAQLNSPPQKGNKVAQMSREEIEQAEACLKDVFHAIRKKHISESLSNIGILEYASALGVAMTYLGKLKKAKAVFSIATQMNPQDETTLRNYGTALARLGKKEKALMVYERWRDLVITSRATALSDLEQQLENAKKHVSIADATKIQNQIQTINSDHLEDTVPHGFIPSPEA